MTSEGTLELEDAQGSLLTVPLSPPAQCIDQRHVQLAKFLMIIESEMMLPLPNSVNHTLKIITNY